MTEIACAPASNNDQSSGKNENSPEFGKFLSSLPKESLKSLLYLMTGKPDSNIKLFHRPVFIDQNDISELNDAVQQKLAQHQTPVSQVTIDISYSKNKFTTYGSWQEFIDTKWNIPNTIESMSIKWDFFVLWPTYAVPQRHTLSIKIASRLKPLQILQAVFSKDPDEMDDFEIIAPVMCRVDFIDHLMSEELINIVEKWVEARKQPEFITPPNTFLKMHKDKIARIIHYSTPTLSAIALVSFLFNFTDKLGLSAVVTVTIMRCFMLWLLFSSMTISTLTLLGKYLAAKAFNSIDNYGQFSTFNITNGDKNRKTEFDKKNSKHMRSFVLNCVVSLILNIVAGVITFYMLTPPK